MGKRSQQQKAHHKQRKAKARAKHEAERGQWDRRMKAKVKAKSRAPINPFAGPAMSMMAMEAMIQRWERQDEVNRFIFTGANHAD